MNAQQLTLTYQYSFLFRCVSLNHNNWPLLGDVNMPYYVFSGTLCSPYRYAIHIYFNKILIGTSFLHCWCVPKYFSQTSFFFCYPANPKSKLTKFKLQKNQNLTQQYTKCYQEVAKNLCITKSSNVQSSSSLKVFFYNHFKICF